MSKVKVLIAYNNNKGIDNIKSAIKDIEYLEVVGSTKKGNEIYNKIIELKPDIVFTKYKMKGFDFMETIRSLGEDAPAIRFLSNKLEMSTKKGIEDIKICKESKKTKKSRISEACYFKEIGINGVIKEIEKCYKRINV